jgi:ClpA/ClpB-like protein
LRMPGLVPDPKRRQTCVTGLSIDVDGHHRVMAGDEAAPGEVTGKWMALSELCRRAHGEEGPAEGLQAISGLRASLDELERQHVGDMLDHGATWAEVADAIGISRQAAHRRFRRPPRRRPTAPPSTEVQQILVTGVARETVRLAREEAAALGAPAVGTEHLLLALARSAPESVARALKSAGIDEEVLRASLQPTIIDDGDPSQAEGTFTRYAREVLERSLGEAVERGEGFIGPDHLLLALVRNPAGGAAQTLEALGVEPLTVLDALASQRPTSGSSPAREKGPA